MQYKPEESVAEKKERLAMIEKQAQERLEAETISDLEENFDDFEIEEPGEVTTDNKRNCFGIFLRFQLLRCGVLLFRVFLFAAKKPVHEKLSSNVKSDLRKRSTDVSAVQTKQEDEDSSLSDYDEEADEEPGEIKSSPRRKPSFVSSDEEDHPVQTKTKSKVSLVDNRRRRRVTSHVVQPFLFPERSLSHRKSDNSKSKWRGDDYDEDMFEQRPLPPPDDARAPRKRRINVAKLEEKSSKLSVKQRLGSSRAEPRSKRNENLDFEDGERDLDVRRKIAGREKDDVRRKAAVRLSNLDVRRKATTREKHVSVRRNSADREKDVDARIRRISEQNAKIMKRRKMIELEEREFRLKPS